MDSFTRLFEAAHAGAYGMNTLPEPSRAQRETDDYTKGHGSFQGIPVVIENPRGSMRKWSADDGTSGENLQTAHYGGFAGVTGADGDELDCYIGPYPEIDQVFVINQFVRGAWDEHKVMIGFPDRRTAESVYLSNFKPGWPGLNSCVACTVDQLKWWMANGDLSKPLTPEQLPNEERKAMEKVLWDSAEQPQPKGATLAQVLYAIREHDKDDVLIFDAVTMADILEDSDGVIQLDALVLPYRKLERQMAILQKLLNRVGGDLSVLAMQVTDPFKRNGTTNIAAIFELSDGQTLTIFFHNPDVTPGKIMPSDELVSWKWMLNKKDVTIVVAPERGRDLNVRSVAARVMMLAKKNSARFQTANAKRAAVMEAIDTLKGEFETKTETLNGLLSEIADLEVKVATKPPKAADPEPQAAAEPEVPLATQVAAAMEPDEKTVAQTAIDNQDNATLDAIQAALDAQIDALSLEDLRQMAIYEPTSIAGGDKLDEYDLRAKLKQMHPDDIQTSLGYLATLRESIAAEEAARAAAAAAQPELPLEPVAVVVPQPEPVIETPVGIDPEAVAAVPAADGAPDITYRAVDDMFTAFYPETAAGQEAWKSIAEQTDGTGKVLHAQVEGTIQQLREAGYTVAEAPAPVAASADDLFAALAEPDAAAVVAVAAEPEAAAPAAVDIDSLPGVVSAEVPFDGIADTSRWLVMNAPRPLVGDTVLDNGPMLEGRFYALIDLSDAGAAQAITENRSNGAVAVFAADKATQIAMALQTIDAEYLPAYLEMSAQERDESIGSQLADLNKGKTYGELKALAAKGMPEGAAPVYVEPPHKSEQVLDALADLGWIKTEHGTVKKDVGGGDTSGELNPEGNRYVFAQFDDTARYLALMSGFDTVFDIDTRDGTAHDLALAFNTRTMEWAASTAYQAPTPEPEAAPGLSVEERIARAAEMGAQAFADGLGSAPALNPAVMPLIAGLPVGGGTNDILTAYTKAWHTANAANARIAPEAAPPKLQFAQLGPYTGFVHDGKVVTENNGYQPLAKGWKLYSDEDVIAFKNAKRSTNAGAVGIAMRAFEASPQEYIDRAESWQAAINAKPEPVSQASRGKGMKALERLTAFMPSAQRRVIGQMMAGEEGQHFIDKAIEWAGVIDMMPKTYEQDGKGLSAVAYLHYFSGGSDFYITEKDKTGNGTKQAFGLAVLNGRRDDAEIGYISIDELVRNGVELDLYWEAAPIGYLKDPDWQPETDEPEAAPLVPAAAPEPAPEPIPEPAPASAQPAAPVDMENYIKVSADSIAELRRVDVYRVLNSLAADNIDGVTRAALANWIIANRPDLTAEVTSVMAEEWPGELDSTAVDPVVPVDQPLPEGTNAVPAAAGEGDDPLRAADLAFLSDVTEGRIDMWTNDPSERIEAIVQKYGDDAAVVDAARAAINAYVDEMSKSLN